MPSLETRQPRIERPASLKDAAYQQIKNALVSGQLERGRFYSAQHFAELLGVSRTPIREALLQLANEGFLVCQDVRGFKLKDYAAKEIRDVFETRVLIEMHVIGQVADDMPAEDLRQLEQNLKQMTSLARKRDAQAFLEADKEFHMIPLRRCGNLHLLTIMENIRNHISILSLKALGHPGRFEAVLREHAALLDALRNHDRKKAVQAIGHHLDTTRTYWLRMEGAEESSDH